MKYENQICQLLRQLGVNNSYVGFRYAVQGAMLNIQNPQLLTYISKGIYAEIACNFHTTIGCVERNIRTVVNTIWTRGNRELLRQIFNCPLNEKPRNSSFIDALSQYVLLQSQDNQPIL